MKIFEVDSSDEMKDGAVARQVDENGNPVDEETKMTNENHGLKFAIRPIKDFCIGVIEFPTEIVDEINEHIDNNILPVKNNEKSSQLDYALDDAVGEQLKIVFNQIGTTYLKQGYERDSTAELFQCWINNAYAGEYDFSHDDGSDSVAGLSGYLSLKVPECISKKEEVPDYTKASFLDLYTKDDSVDGFAHLVWGTNTQKDILQLKGRTEDYAKPIVGKMLIFPRWMKYSDMPFFGMGERRTLVMNWNVID